jgi:hypothetical protein
MLLSSKPETRISLQFTGPIVSRKPSRSSLPSAAAAYTFDTDAEEEARDTALTAIASLAGRVDEALRRLETDDHLRPVPLLREAVAPNLENGAAAAHDAARRAFFAPAASEKKEDHVPTMALWALASIGRAYPERMLHICQRTDEEECTLFAAQAHGYYTALHVALYTRRPETFYARRQFLRCASARIEEVLDEQGGGDSVRTWLHHPRLS